MVDLMATSVSNPCAIAYSLEANTLRVTLLHFIDDQWSMSRPESRRYVNKLQRSNDVLASAKQPSPTAWENNRWPRMPSSSDVSLRP
jgi:hypothetical protein